MCVQTHSTTLLTRCITIEACDWVPDTQWRHVGGTCPARSAEKKMFWSCPLTFWLYKYN